METIYQEKDQNLANALRVIGQELADLLPLILKMRLNKVSSSSRVRDCRNPRTPMAPVKS